MGEAFLEFKDASMESLGCLVAGRLKLSDSGAAFKSTKTGKVDSADAASVQECRWVRLANKPSLKLTLADGKTLRYGGFTDADFERVKAFVKVNWKVEMEAQEPAVCGWNYGRARFDKGNTLEFEVDEKEAFEVPLYAVSNCNVQRNEAVIEFHQNDECPVSLMEMRFHIPADGDAAVDAVEEFRKNVMRFALTEETGKPLAVLEDILCLTPRGRFDIKMYPRNLALHGQSYDYKIPIKSILRLFLLPHKNGGQMYFVVSLDPPIRQGQTRYHYLVLEFNKDDEIDQLELGMTDEQLEENYHGKLDRVLSGPVYEIVSKIMRAVVNQKITIPGGFTGHSGTSAVQCAYKQANGFLYPLEKGFIYVHKPPMYIRFEEIGCVNFARSELGAVARSFDFEIELKTGSSHAFNNVDREEYPRLYDFVSKKKLRIRDAKRLDVPSYNYKDDFAGSSDDDDDRDHYKERLKKEAKEREQNDGESDSEDDSDYDPDKSASKATAERAESASASEPDEEYDSDARRSSASDDADPPTDLSPKKPRKEPSAKPKPKQATTSKPRKKKAAKDPAAPKRAQTAYFFWLGEMRDEIKQPGMSVVDVSKKAGELWRALDDKTKWNKLAQDDKARYDREMDAYKRSGAHAAAAAAASSSRGSETSSGKSKKAKTSPTKSPVKGKSKEFVSDDSDSSGSDKPLSQSVAKSKAAASATKESGTSEESDGSASGND